MVDQRRTPVLLKPALAGATGAVTTQCLTMLGRLPGNCNPRPATVKRHLDAIPKCTTLTSSTLTHHRGTRLSRSEDARGPTSLVSLCLGGQAVAALARA